MHVETIGFAKGNQHSATVSPKGNSMVSCMPLSRNLGLDLSDIDTCHHIVQPPKVAFLDRSGWELLAGHHHQTRPHHTTPGSNE